MTLISLIVALLIEQLRPPAAHRPVVETMHRFSDKVADLYNDGSVNNGRLGWCLVVIGSGLATLMVYYLLWGIHPVLAFVFNVAALYATLDFRHYGVLLSDIVFALSTGRLEEARRRLGEWRGTDHSGAGAEEVARLAVEQSLVWGHRSIFGVLFWFTVLPGPVGAVMYRLATHLARDWGERADPEFGRFGEFARSALGAIDWVPVRLTALAFSVIGNFEDAMYCWRSQSVLWPDRASGILISSGAGAMGVRLGLPIHENGRVVDRPEMGLGQRADAGYVQSAAKLVWRVLVLYVLFVALLGIAGWVGG